MGTTEHSGQEAPKVTTENTQNLTCPIGPTWAGQICIESLSSGSYSCTTWHAPNSSHSKPSRKGRTKKPNWIGKPRFERRLVRAHPERTTDSPRPPPQHGNHGTLRPSCTQSNYRKKHKTCSRQTNDHNHKLPQLGRLPI